MNPATSSPAVMEALQRRSGAPTPMLGQVSPGAPMQNQVPQPMNPSSMTASSTPPAPRQTQAQKYQPQNQEDVIVMALVEHLKNSIGLKKEEMKLSEGNVQIPQTTPDMTPSSDFMSAPSMPTSQMQGGSPFGGAF